MSRPRKDRQAISNGCRKRKLGHNNNRVGVRLSKPEREILEMLAAKKQCSRAEYLRRLLFDCAMRELPPSKPLSELLRELGQ
jgi:hypothetical protein